MKLYFENIPKDYRCNSLDYGVGGKFQVSATKKMSSTTAGGKSLMKFVKERGQSTDPVMLQAAQMLEEKGSATVQWVWSEDVQRLDKNSIFVLEKFEMELYHFLLKKTKIIGPLAIIAHLTNNWPLPLDRERPVHNMTLFGVTVCVTQTGADPEKRARILELASFMGGRIRNDFTKRVTHLVAGQVGSSKYKAARSQKIPVLKVSWIDYCWERGQKELICGTDTDILSSHKCSPLSGCIISSTGYNVEERNTLEQLVNQNGGQYSRQLTKESCTHLIVGSITSQKFQCAQQWKIHCIAPQWLYKSIETGYWQDETDYPVGGGEEKKRVSSSDQSTTSTSSSNKIERNGGESLLKKRSASSNSSNDTVKKMKSLQEEDDFDEETLLSQYQNAELPSPPAVVVNGFFTGIRVSISEVLSTHGNTTIASEIKKNGGSVVSPDMSCDYHITSLSRPPILPPQATNIVTIIWLEHCLLAETIIDHTSHFLFHPLPVTINNLVLRGCVLTISQFSGLEREHLICLSKSLGAVVQDYFSHYSNGELLASTHLVLKEPKGDKYTSAISWGVPAVSQEWLFECAKSQLIVSTDNYLVKETPPTPPTLSLNNERVSIGGASMREESIIKTPLRSFYPNFDVESALHEVAPQSTDSPHYDTQLANQFDENMVQALQTISEAENEVENRKDCLKDVVVFIHKKLASKQGELYPIVKSLGGTIRRSYTRDCTHVIYQGKEIDSSRDKQLITARNNGCIIVSHYWLLACSKSGYREDESFFPFHYNPNKSLNILSQRMVTSPPSNKDKQQRVNSHQTHQLPKEREKKSEQDCEQKEKDEERKEERDIEEEEEELMEEDESFKMDTLQEDNATSSHLLQQQIQAIMENNGLNQNATGANVRRLMRKPMPGMSSANKDSSKTKKQSVRRFNKLRDSPPADNLLTESQLMTVTYQDIDNQHEAALLDIIKQPHFCPETMADDHSIKTSQAKDHTPRLPLVGGVKDHISKLPLMGGTKDHTPKLPLLKKGVSDPTPMLSSVGGALNNHTPKLSSIDTRDLLVQEAPPTPVPPTLHLPIVTANKAKTSNNSLFVTERRSTLRSSKVVLPLKIQLSSLSAQEKADYGALIQELGGLYLESDRFISDCTHLIVGRSSRAEKFLAACATGKWILQKSFMEASRSEGQFVNEEEHEWSSTCQPVGKSSSLDDAPKKWRLKLQSQPNSRGAFVGWKVLLCVESFKHNGLKRLLEAGGASVTTPTQSITTLPSLTHAFIHLPSLPKELTIETLVQYNVPCLRPDYIAEYIQTGTPIDTTSFMLSEALKLNQITNEK